jgi:glucose/arabinose dehydrogenase
MRPGQRRIVATFSALAILFTVSTGTALGANPVMRSTVVQSGLSIPWDVAFASSGQMFVTERAGYVSVYAHGGWHAPLLYRSTIANVRAEGESGVMGIAVDHYFRVNRLVYVCASRQVGGQWRNQLLRYRVNSGWRLVDEMVMIPNMFASRIHNGCAVEEGPDQRIWLTMGDAASSMRAQDPNSLNGKVLRIGRDGSIPADNPIMPGASGRSFVYSMGHRNPQGITFQPGSNRAYVAEHGPELNDEINWIRAGRNYGWPCVTGYNVAYTSCPGVSATFTQPVWRSGSSTIATSGAAFVTGTKWGNFTNDLFVSTLKQADLRRFDVAATGSPAIGGSIYFNGTYGRLRATVLGPNSFLYLTSSNGSNDKVIRIVPYGG